MTERKNATAATKAINDRLLEELPSKIVGISRMPSADYSHPFLMVVSSGARTVATYGTPGDSLSSKRDLRPQTP